MPALMTNSGPDRRQCRRAAARECEAFLAKVDKPMTWEMPHVLIEDGPPTLLLNDYVRARDVELVVLGTRRRSAVLELFNGSTAKTIMDEVPCDVLVVRSRAHP